MSKDCSYYNPIQNLYQIFEPLHRQQRHTVLYSLQLRQQTDLEIKRKVYFSAQTQQMLLKQKIITSQSLMWHNLIFFLHALSHGLRNTYLNIQITNIHTYIQIHAFTLLWFLPAFTRIFTIHVYLHNTFNTLKQAVFKANAKLFFTTLHLSFLLLWQRQRKQGERVCESAVDVFFVFALISFLVE